MGGVLARQPGGAVVSTHGSQQEVPGFEFSGWLGFSVWSLHALPMLVWVFSGCSGFLPQPKRHEWVMLTANSKLALGVNSFSLSV